MIKQRFTLTFILALTLSMLNSTTTTTSAQVKPISTSQANYPEFSWDHIPRYMHIRKDHAYTAKEIKFIAKFPLITFEKSNGHKTHQIKHSLRFQTPYSVIKKTIQNSFVTA